MTFLTLSILGSNILGVMVASLVAMLVVTKVIGMFWDRYKRKRQAVLKSLALEFLNTGNDEAKIRLNIVQIFAMLCHRFGKASD
ncbi:hypothetical protein MUO65_00620 [bacterium]|nr:hypothetical protein [bacterium]